MISLDLKFSISLKKYSLSVHIFYHRDGAFSEDIDLRLHQLIIDSVSIFSGTRRIYDEFILTCAASKFLMIFLHTKIAFT